MAILITRSSLCLVSEAEGGTDYPPAAVSSAVGHKRKHSETIGKSEQPPVHPSSVTCDVCGMCCTSVDALRKHLQTHNTSEKPYECQTCSQKFSYSAGLRRHEKKHGEWLYKCDECPSRFYRSDSLLEHKRCHLGLSKRKFLQKRAKLWKMNSNAKNNSSLDSKPTDAEVFANETDIFLAINSVENNSDSRDREAGEQESEGLLLPPHQSHDESSIFPVREDGELAPLASTPLSQSTQSILDTLLPKLVNNTSSKDLDLTADPHGSRAAEISGEQRSVGGTSAVNGVQKREHDDCPLTSRHSSMVPADQSDEDRLIIDQSEIEEAHECDEAANT